MPRFAPHRRGFGRDTTPMFHYRGADIREALDGLRQEAGDPYDGLALRFVNPATGASLFPTLDYGAQLLRPGEATRFKRETASTLYIAIEGEGVTRSRRAALRLAGERHFCRAGLCLAAPQSTRVARTRSFTPCPTLRCSIRSANIGRRAGCPTTRSPSSCLSVNGGITT